MIRGNLESLIHVCHSQASVLTIRLSSCNQLTHAYTSTLNSYSVPFIAHGGACRKSEISVFKRLTSKSRLLLAITHTFTLPMQRAGSIPCSAIACNVQNAGHTSQCRDSTANKGNIVSRTELEPTLLSFWCEHPSYSYWLPGSFNLPTPVACEAWYQMIFNFRLKLDTRPSVSTDLIHTSGHGVNMRIYFYSNLFIRHGGAKCK